MFYRAPWLLVTAGLLLMAAPPRLHARDGDQVHIGQSITVGQDENVGSVVCLGCSVRMEGTSGDVVVIGGSVLLEGAAKGDVVAIGGGVVLGENASISGDVVTMGGRLSRHPNAVVKGDVVEQSGAVILVGIFLVPLLPVILIIALIVWLVRRKGRPMPAPARQP